MKNKKGLTGPMASLSALALGIFVFAIYFAVTFKGVTAVQATIPQDTTVNNATYANLTKLLGSVGQFTNYTDLIVIVGILSVVIGMVMYLGGNNR